jgi:hypothetical protein
MMHGNMNVKNYGDASLHIVTYCYLLLGPATVGQYLDLEPSASEIALNSRQNDVLSAI